MLPASLSGTIRVDGADVQPYTRAAVLGKICAKYDAGHAPDGSLNAGSEDGEDGEEGEEGDADLA